MMSISRPHNNNYNLRPTRISRYSSSSSSNSCRCVSSTTTNVTTHTPPSALSLLFVVTALLVVVSVGGLAAGTDTNTTTSSPSQNNSNTLTLPQSNTNTHQKTPTEQKTLSDRISATDTLPATPSTNLTGSAPHTLSSPLSSSNSLPRTDSQTDTNTPGKSATPSSTWLTPTSSRGTNTLSESNTDGNFTESLPSTATASLRRTESHVPTTSLSNSLSPSVPITPTETHPPTPTPTDSITPTGGTFSHSSTLTPSLTTTQSLVVTATLSSLVTRSITQSLSSIVTLSDIITTSDSLLVTTSASNTQSSPQTTSATITASAEETASDSPTLSLSAIPTLTDLVTLSVSLPATPTITLPHTATETLSTSISFGTTTATAPITPSVTTTISHVLTMSESLPSTNTPSVSTTQSITLSIPVTSSISLPITQSVTLSLSIPSTISLSISKSVTSSTTQTTSLSVSLPITDTQSLAETTSISLTTSMAITQSVSLTQSLPVTETQSLPITDTVSIPITSSKSGNTFTLSSSTSQSVSTSRTFTTSLSLPITASQTPDDSISVSISTSITATFSITLSTTLSLTTTLSASPSAGTISTTSTMTLSVSESISESESISGTRSTRVIKWFSHQGAPSTPSTVSVVRHYLNTTSTYTLLRRRGSSASGGSGGGGSGGAVRNGTNTTSPTQSFHRDTNTHESHSHTKVSTTHSTTTSRGHPSHTLTTTQGTASPSLPVVGGGGVGGRTVTAVRTPESALWEVVSTVTNTSLVELTKEQLWAIEKVLTTAATTTPTTNGSSSSPTTPSTSATIDAILATTSTTTSDGAVDVDPQLISEDEGGWRQVVTSEGTQFFLLEAGVIYDDGSSDTIRSETAPTYSRYANETFADFERRYNTYYHARSGVRGSEVNVMQEDIYFNLWPNAAAYVAASKEALRVVLGMQSTHDTPSPSTTSTSSDFEEAFINTIVGRQTASLPMHTSEFTPPRTTRTPTPPSMSKSKTHTEGDVNVGASRTSTHSSSKSLVPPTSAPSSSSSSSSQHQHNRTTAKVETASKVAEEFRCYPHLPSPYQARAEWIGPPPMFGFVVPPKPILHIPDFVNGVPKSALSQSEIAVFQNTYQQRTTEWKAQVQIQLTRRDEWLNEAVFAPIGISREDFFAVINTCEASNEKGVLGIDQRFQDILMVSDLNYIMYNIADEEEIATREVTFDMDGSGNPIAPDGTSTTTTTGAPPTTTGAPTTTTAAAAATTTTLPPSNDGNATSQNNNRTATKTSTSTPTSSNPRMSKEESRTVTTSHTDTHPTDSITHSVGTRTQSSVASPSLTKFVNWNAVTVNRTYVRYNRRNSIQNLYRWSSCRRAMYQVRFPRAGLWVACHGTNIPRPLTPSNHTDALKNASSPTPPSPTNTSSPTTDIKRAKWVPDEPVVSIAQTASSPVQKPPTSGGTWYTNPLQIDLRRMGKCLNTSASSSSPMKVFGVFDERVPKIRPVTSEGSDAAKAWYDTSPYQLLKKVAVVLRQPGGDGGSGLQLELPDPSDTSAYLALLTSVGLPPHTPPAIAFSQLLTRALKMRLRQAQLPDWLRDFPVIVEPLWQDWSASNRIEEVPTIRRFNTMDELFLPAYVAASSLEAPSPEAPTTTPTPSYATNNSVFDVTAVSTTQEATMKSLVVVAPYEVRFADVTNDPDQLSSAGTVRYSYNGKAAPCRYTSQYLKALYSGDTRLQGLTTSTYRAGLMAAQEEALRVADSGDSATTYDRLRQHFAQRATYLSEVDGLQQLYTPSLVSERYSPWASCDVSQMDSTAPYIFSPLPGSIDSTPKTQHVDPETGRRVTSISRDGGGGFWPQYDLVYFLRLNRTCGEGMGLLRRRLLDPLRRLAAQQYSLGDTPLYDVSNAASKSGVSSSSTVDTSIPLTHTRVAPSYASLLPYRRPSTLDTFSSTRAAVRLPAEGVLWQKAVDPLGAAVTVEEQQLLFKHAVAALRPFPQRLSLPTAMLMSCASGGPRSTCRPQVQISINTSTPPSEFSPAFSPYDGLPADNTHHVMWWCDSNPSHDTTSAPNSDWCTRSQNLSGTVTSSYSTINTSLLNPSGTVLSAAGSVGGSDYMLVSNAFSCPSGSPSWFPYILTPTTPILLTTILPLQSESYYYPTSSDIIDTTTTSPHDVTAYTTTTTLSQTSPFVRALNQIQTPPFSSSNLGDASFIYSSPSFTEYPELVVERQLVNGTYSVAPNAPSFYRLDGVYPTRRCFLTGRLSLTSSSSSSSNILTIEIPCDVIPIAFQSVRNATSPVAVTSEVSVPGTSGEEKERVDESHNVISFVEESVPSTEYNDKMPLSEAKRIEEDALINVARYVAAMKVRLASYTQQAAAVVDSTVRSAMVNSSLSTPSGPVLLSQVLPAGDTSLFVRTELVIPVEMLGTPCNGNTSSIATTNTTAGLRILRVTNAQLGAPLFAFPDSRAFCLYNCDECQSCGTHAAFTGSTSLCLTSGRGLITYNPADAMHRFVSKELSGPNKKDYMVNLPPSPTLAPLVPYSPRSYIPTYRIDALAKPIWNFFATLSEIKAIPELQRGEMQRVTVRGAGLVPAAGILSNDIFQPGAVRIDRLVAALDECTFESVARQDFRASSEGKIVSYQRTTDYYDVSGLPSSSAKALISTMTEVNFEIPTNWLDANDLSFASNNAGSGSPTTTTAAPPATTTTLPPIGAPTTTSPAYHYEVGRIPGTGNYTSKYGAYDGIRYKHNSHEYYLLCFFSARSQSWQEAARFLLRPRLDLSRTYPDKPIIPMTWTQTVLTKSMTTTVCGGWISMRRQVFTDTEFRDGSVTFELFLEGGNNAFQSQSLDYINQQQQLWRAGGVVGGGDGATMDPSGNSTTSTTPPTTTTSSAPSATGGGGGEGDTPASVGSNLRAVYLDNYAQRLYGLSVTNVQLVSESVLAVTVGQVAMHVFPTDEGGPYGTHERRVIQQAGKQNPMADITPEGKGYLQFRMFVNPMMLFCAPRSDDAMGGGIPVVSNRRRLLSTDGIGDSDSGVGGGSLASGGGGLGLPPDVIPATPTSTLPSHTSLLTPSQTPTASLPSRTDPYTFVPTETHNPTRSQPVTSTRSKYGHTKTIQGNPLDLDGDPLSEGFFVVEDYHFQYSLKHATTITAAAAGGLASLVGTVATFGAVGLGTSGSMPLFLGPQLIASFELLTCRPPLDLSISSDLLSTINPIVAFYFGVSPTIHTSNAVLDPDTGLVAIKSGVSVGGKEYGTSKIAAGCLGCIFAIFFFHFILMTVYRVIIRDYMLRKSRVIRRRLERDKFRKFFTETNSQFKPQVCLRKADAVFDTLIRSRRAQRRDELGVDESEENDSFSATHSFATSNNKKSPPTSPAQRPTTATLVNQSLSPILADEGGGGTNVDDDNLVDMSLSERDGSVRSRRESLMNISLGRSSGSNHSQSSNSITIPTQPPKLTASFPGVGGGGVSSPTLLMRSAIDGAKRWSTRGDRSMEQEDLESDDEFIKANPSTWTEAAAALSFPSVSLLFLSYFFLGAVLFSMRYLIAGDETIANPYSASPISSLAALSEEATVVYNKTAALTLLQDDSQSIYLRTIRDGDLLIDRSMIRIANSEVMGDSELLVQKVVAAIILGVTMLFILIVWQRAYLRTKVRIYGIDKKRIQQVDTFSLRREAKNINPKDGEHGGGDHHQSPGATTAVPISASPTTKSSTHHNNRHNGEDDGGPQETLSPLEKVERLLSGIGPVLRVYLNAEDSTLRYFDPSMYSLYRAFRTPLGMLVLAKSSNAYHRASYFLSRRARGASLHTSAEVANFGGDDDDEGGGGIGGSGQLRREDSSYVVPQYGEKDPRGAAFERANADPWIAQYRARQAAHDKWSPEERSSWDKLIQRKLLFLVHPSWVQRGGMLLKLKGQWVPMYPNLLHYLCVIFTLQPDNIFGYVLPFATATCTCLVMCIPKSIIGDRCTVQGVLIVVVMSIAALTILVRQPERLAIDNFISALHYIALGAVALAVGTGSGSYNSLLLLATLVVSGTIFAKVATTMFVFYVYDRACSGKMVSTREKLVALHRRRHAAEKRYNARAEEQRALGAMLAQLDVWDGVEGVIDENGSPISQPMDDNGAIYVPSDIDDDFDIIPNHQDDDESIDSLDLPNENNHKSPKALTAAAKKAAAEKVKKLFGRLFAAGKNPAATAPTEGLERFETDELNLAEWRNNYRLLEPPVYEEAASVDFTDLDLLDDNGNPTTTNNTQQSPRGIQRVPINIDDLFLLDDDTLLKRASEFRHDEHIELDSFSTINNNEGGSGAADVVTTTSNNSRHHRNHTVQNIRYDFHFDDLDLDQQYGGKDHSDDGSYVEMDERRNHTTNNNDGGNDNHGGGGTRIKRRQSSIAHNNTSQHYYDADDVEDVDFSSISSDGGYQPPDPPPPALPHSEAFPDEGDDVDVDFTNLSSKKKKAMSPSSQGGPGGSGSIPPSSTNDDDIDEDELERVLNEYHHPTTSSSALTQPPAATTTRPHGFVGDDVQLEETLDMGRDLPDFEEVEDNDNDSPSAIATSTTQQRQWGRPSHNPPPPPANTTSSESALQRSQAAADRARDVLRKFYDSNAGL